MSVPPADKVKSKLWPNFFLLNIFWTASSLAHVAMSSSVCLSLENKSIFLPMEMEEGRNKRCDKVSTSIVSITDKLSAIIVKIMFNLNS